METTTSPLGHILRQDRWGADGRVLIVEDDPMLCEILAEIVRGEGCEVRTAADGADALELVRDWPPSLILLDLRMPRVDGYEFARQYREMPGRHAPIILLSGDGDREDAQAVIGAVATIDKPFRLAQLVRIVDEYVECADNES